MVCVFTFCLPEEKQSKKKQRSSSEVVSFEGLFNFLSFFLSFHIQSKTEEDGDHYDVPRVPFAPPPDTEQDPDSDAQSDDSFTE